MCQAFLHIQYLVQLNRFGRRGNFQDLLKKNFRPGRSLILHKQFTWLHHHDTHPFKIPIWQKALCRELLGELQPRETLNQTSQSQPSFCPILFLLQRKVHSHYHFFAEQLLVSTNRLCEKTERIYKITGTFPGKNSK